MSKFFSIKDIASEADPVQEDKNAIQSLRFTGLHDMKVGNLTELIKRYPGNQEAFFIWTVNSFNAFTFIPYLIKNSGTIKELIISTYSINIKIIDALSGFLQKGLVESVYILISDSAKFRIPTVIDHLEQFSSNNQDKVSVRYAWNHSKVTLISTGDHYFVIEGSGNFSENSRHEQYIFLNSEEIFNFRKKWITDEIHGRTV